MKFKSDSLPRCRNGKLCYPSEEEAEIASKRHQEDLKMDLRVYKCHLCQDYHLTKVKEWIEVKKPTFAEMRRLAYIKKCKNE